MGSVEVIESEEEAGCVREREREGAASINIPGARYRYGSRSRTRRTRSTPSGLSVQQEAGASLSYRREMFLSRLYIESTSIVPRIKLSFRRGLRERESISREGGFPPCATPRLPLPRQGSRINAMFRLENRHFARTFFKISFLKFYNSFSSKEGIRIKIAPGFIVLGGSPYLFSFLILLLIFQS